MTGIKEWEMVKCTRAEWDNKKGGNLKKKKNRFNKKKIKRALRRIEIFLHNGTLEEKKRMFFNKKKVMKRIYNTYVTGD